MVWGYLCKRRGNCWREARTVDCQIYIIVLWHERWNEKYAYYAGMNRGIWRQNLWEMWEKIILSLLHTNEKQLPIILFHFNENHPHTLLGNFVQARWTQLSYRASKQSAAVLKSLFTQTNSLCKLFSRVQFQRHILKVKPSFLAQKVKSQLRLVKKL